MVARDVGSRNRIRVAREGASRGEFSRAGLDIGGGGLYVVRVMSRANVLWSLLSFDSELLGRLSIEGDAVLPSSFEVTAFAADAIGVATLAVAELLAARRGTEARARVSSRAAAAAFREEALFKPIGWELPPVWDPIAGDYATRDGRFIRLHTNYASHRAAALRVLGTKPERDAVREAVLSFDGGALESAIVHEGGCAAVMYSREEWLRHEHGSATHDEPPIAIERVPTSPSKRLPPLSSSGALPLEGVKVLDVTRVLAGPICTKTLARYGATVLRIDPPGFEEVPAVIPIAAVGKSCAWLDLHTSAGRVRFEELVAEADVLVHGLRPDALSALGWGEARLRSQNPTLIIATLAAYGWRGPWRSRRGFDSLVQMSTGIAATPRGLAKPSPLPAQALDYCVGYLLAAAVCRGLLMREREEGTLTARGALLGAANHLWSGAVHGGDEGLAAPIWEDALFEEIATPWGQARRARGAGSIDESGGRTVLPRALGSDQPRFA